MRRGTGDIPREVRVTSLVCVCVNSVYVCERERMSESACRCACVFVRYCSEHENLDIFKGANANAILVTVSSYTTD